LVQEINFINNSGQHASSIRWKGGLFRDFENFNLLHEEFLRTREKRVMPFP
jgi:hypothetical protein